jgi:hypothetical protein
MILTKSREYTVNMGNYESLKFGASVEVETDQLAIPEGTAPSDAGIVYADQLLVDALREDIRKASELTGVGTSYIHTIDADINA